MQTIDTGYKPEFGLGAYFAGQNAANAADLNQEELIRNFLANQQAKQTYDKDTQMNPLLIAEQRNKNTIGDYEAALATAKNESPTYKNMLLKGTEGQMQSQITASEKGKALAPFQIAAEQAAAETDKNRQGVLWTMQNLDKQLAAGGGIDKDGLLLKPFSPTERAMVQAQRDMLTNQLKNTPEFAGKKELSDDKIEAQLEAMRLRMQGQLDAAESKAKAASEKFMSDKQLMAQQLKTYFDPTSTPEQKATAQAILTRMQADKIEQNAALTNPQIDINALSDGKVPMTTPPAALARSKADEAAKNVVPRAAPQNQADWNAAWAALGKGQSMTGLDGKQYIKK